MDPAVVTRSRGRGRAELRIHLVEVHPPAPDRGISAHVAATSPWEY